MISHSPERDPKPRRPSIFPVTAGLGLMAILSRPVEAQQGKATITGGADASGHTYSWSVTNRHTSSIVRVEIPHFRANLFFAPPEWGQDCTGLVNVGVREAPGVCDARASTPQAGIAPGRSATFSMQIASAGAQRRPGSMLVHFADGTESLIENVELPQRESGGDQFIPLIGLSLVFGLWVVIQTYRKRPRQTHNED